ncbi:ABC transporter permease subunit [Halomarina halobia]|uniref:ABC transporter permease subunit n=1 Tax=Halomarina halobia TaxID=3033386 RepID=A0ABD6A8U1_9EURY|nr:ABC transporter permease subunit [Halomarina sp. PSR21]
MSWTAVARKDFHDSARSKWLWGLSALFVLFAAGVAYFYSNIATPGSGAEVLGLLGFLLLPTGLLVPIIGLMISYKAIVGERESGSLKLLLSLPHTRSEMILGKFVGRTLSVVVAIAVGFAVAAAVVVAEYGSLEPGAYGLFVLLTMFFALVYIGIGIGFSSFMSSTSKALAGAVGLFVVLEFLWDVVPLVLLYVINGFTLTPRTPPSETIQNLVTFVSTLSPSAAYGNAARALIPGLETGATDVPFYLQEWFGLVVLVCWLVVPLALGFAQFNRADL